MIDATTLPPSSAITLEEQKRRLKSLKAKANLERSRSEKVADAFVGFSGSAVFLVLNMVLFVVWIIFNLGLFFKTKVPDPYPFVFLTTFVSLEAIILAIFVLISQNRQTQIDDLREEVDLQLDLHMQEQNHKMLKMLEEIRASLNIARQKDPELRAALKQRDPEEIAVELKSEMGK